MMWLIVAAVAFLAVVALVLDWSIAVEFESRPQDEPDEIGICAFCYDGGRCLCDRCRIVHTTVSPTGTPLGGYRFTGGPCQHCRRTP